MNFDFDRIWNQLSHILATSASYFLSGDSHKIILLENNTDRKFITGDQPVVNTFTSNLPAGQPVSELEFYYPITPDTAVLVTKREEFKGKSNFLIAGSEVGFYNNHIYSNRLTEIYGNNSDQLSLYKSGL